jgi:hypothetical protein
MKNIALIFVLILGVTFSAQCREAVTAEEQNTVGALQTLGIIENDRTPVYLNQPMPAIDAMSMELKGINVVRAENTAVVQVVSQQIMENVSEKIEVCGSEVKRVESTMNESDANINDKLCKLEKEKDEIKATYFWGGLLFFTLGLLF